MFAFNLCKASIPKILSQCKSHVHQHNDLSVNILAMIPEYTALLASSAEFDAVEQLLNSVLAHTLKDFATLAL